MPIKTLSVGTKPVATQSLPTKAATGPTTTNITQQASANSSSITLVTAKAAISTKGATAASIGSTEKLGYPGTATSILANTSQEAKNTSSDLTLAKAIEQTTVADVINQAQKEIAVGALLQQVLGEQASDPNFFIQEKPFTDLEQQIPGYMPGHSLPDKVTSFVFTATANNLDMDYAGVISDNQITVTVPYGTNIQTLRPTVTYRGKSFTYGWPSEPTTWVNFTSGQVGPAIPFGPYESVFFLVLSPPASPAPTGAASDGVSGGGSPLGNNAYKQYYVTVKVAEIPAPVQLNIVDLPNGLVEGMFTDSTALVTIPVAQRFPITARVTSDSSALVIGSPEIIIPAGQTKATFLYSTPLNVLIQETQLARVTVTSTSTALPLGVTILNVSKEIRIQEATAKQLILSLATKTYLETAGTIDVSAQKASIIIPQSTVAPLVVSLTSTNPERLVLPNTVTIPAGQVQAYFGFTIVDDPTINNDITDIQITASADTWLPATCILTIQDYSPVPEKLTGKTFLVGFDNINIGIAEYKPDAIYLSKPLDISLPCNVALRTVESRPYLDTATNTIMFTADTYDADEDRYFLASIEYWLVREDYRAGVKISTQRFPILPLGVQRINHERLMLPDVVTLQSNVSGLNYKPMFFSNIDIDSDIRIFRNGTLYDRYTVSGAIGPDTRTVMTLQDYPNAGTRMDNLISLTFDNVNISDIMTISYTPSVSSTRVVPSAPYDTYDNSNQPIVDMVGNLSARHLAENVVALDKLENAQEGDTTALYLLIVLRQNTANRFVSPAVEEYTLLVSNTDSTKFVEL